MEEITSHEAPTTMMVRLPSQGHIAGVCAALSQRHRVDPLLVRVAFLVLAMGGGIGVGLYLAMWALLPAENGVAAPVEGVIGASRQWSSQTLLLVGALFTLVVSSSISSWFDLPLAPVVIVLVVVWAIHRHQTNKQPPVVAPLPNWAPPSPGPSGAPIDMSTEFGQSALAWQQRLAQVDPSRPMPYPAQQMPQHPYAPAGQSHPYGAMQQGAPVWNTTPARPAKRRGSWLAGVFWLAMAAGAGLAAHDLGGGRESNILGYAVALAVVALGLLVGTFTRRPRGLVIAGLVLGTATIVPMVPANVMMASEFNQRYTSVSQLPAETQNFFAADVTLDMRNLEVPEQGATYRMKASGADVTLLAPENADVLVRYTLHGADLRLSKDFPAGEHMGGGSSESLLDRPGDRRLVVEVELNGADMEVIS